jgi:hypothetical protein
MPFCLRAFSLITLIAVFWLTVLFSPLVSAAPPSMLPSPTLPDGLGVNIHFTDPRPGEMEMLAAAGFHWVRMDFDWAAIEKTPGRYDFSAYDRLMAALATYKIRALFILDYRNPLYDGGVSPHTDVGRQAFARWAAAGVRHFAGRGVLWEMYNEPNGGFWSPHADVDGYVPLALAVGKAVKAAAPHEAYIGPASAGLDMPFLEACFRAGVLKYWDAVSVHPYRGDGPETATGDFARLRALIDHYAPAGKQIPILSGEWGYPVEPVLQGKYLARQWLSNMANGIPLSIWYDWHDDGTDPNNPEHHFGTVFNPYHAGQTPPYDPKPSYLAARALTTTLRGFRYGKRLALADPGDYALLFTDGRDTRLALWTTGKPHEVTLPASPGMFHDTALTGEAGEDVQADVHGLRVMLTDAPRYLAPTKPNDLLTVAAHWDRAPLEIAGHAPGSVSRRLLLTNPLNHPISLTLSSGKVAMLLPHCSVSLSAASDLHRDGQALALRFRWSLGGQTVEQRTLVTVSNPLRVMPLGPIGRVLPVRLENPSGEAFAGTLALNGSALLPASTPFRLAAGDLEVTVSVPLAANAPPDFRAAGQVKDAKGQAVLSLPSTTFRPLEGFRGLAADAPTSVYEVLPDGSASVKSEQTLAVVPVPPGLPGAAVPNALRITYRLDDGWKFIRVAPRDAARKTVDGHPAALSLWLYGNGSGLQARMRFTDSTGQTFQPDGVPITWRGWRPVLFPLDATRSGHWGGDGVIHFPVRLDTLLLIDNGSRKATQGVVLFCAPSWIYQTSTSP